MWNKDKEKRKTPVYKTRSGLFFVLYADKNFPHFACFLKHTVNSELFEIHPKGSFPRFKTGEETGQGRLKTDSKCKRVRAPQF